MGKNVANEAEGRGKCRKGGEKKAKLERERIKAIYGMRKREKMKEWSGEELKVKEENKIWSVVQKKQGSERKRNRLLWRMGSSVASSKNEGQN